MAPEKKKTLRFVDTDKEIHEIRLQGRGGQGIVTAGELLGKAAILEGKFAQSIPTFGPERRGALSSCSLRISKRPILLKCSCTTADVLCVLDPTIWHFVDVTVGFADDGFLIFNTTKSPQELHEELQSNKYGYTLTAQSCSLFTVDATGIALEIMGIPITNTAMMGAFAKATGLLKMESVASVLKEKFGSRADTNIRMATEACENVRGHVFNERT
jgi:2-oxoacid:acceptor oxidoreductase gamma subunit (pyruvate/2-ketoisovalerate family)